MDYFKGYTYLSLDRRDNASIHGHPQIHVYPYSFAGKKTYHTICLPIHSMTHMDMSQSLNLDQFMKYFEPKRFKNVAIVNCTEKQAILKEYLMTINNDELYDLENKFPFLDIEKLKKKYLFSWDEISGNDDKRIIEILKDKLKIEWVETENISKFDDGKTIIVSNKEKSLSLKLNDEKNKVILKIDDGRVDEFTVKTEHGKLNIYAKNNVKPENTLLRIIKELEIDEDYIVKKFESSNKKISDFEFIIFRTDWFVFRFNSNTLSNMHFELFHAFLLHPYLTQKTIGHLFKKNRKILGIGSDTSSLNNPINYVNIANAVPFVQNACYASSNEGIFDETEISEDFLNGYLFSYYDEELKIDVTSDILVEKIINIFKNENISLSEDISIEKIGTGKYMIINNEESYIITKIENKFDIHVKSNEIRNFIINVAQLNHVQDNTETITTGELILIPIRSLSEPNGIACELYFKRNK